MSGVQGQYSDRQVCSRHEQPPVPGIYICDLWNEAMAKQAYAEGLAGVFLRVQYSGQRV